MSLLQDVFQLSTLLYQSVLQVSLLLLSLVEVELALAHLSHTLADLLVAKLDFQLLELDLLAQGIILAVVAHGIELRMIALQASLCISNLVLLLINSTVELLDFALDVLNTSGETGDIIFQVLNFERKLTTQLTVLVDARQGYLKLVKSLQLLFNCQICRIFLCHNFFILSLNLYCSF